ncbi:MAG: PASTA domain-containing protein [Syntrophaceae bacterium]|nr:PASTA domain-containing protein [Syntrophaceae bacterium]
MKKIPLSCTVITVLLIVSAATAAAQPAHVPLVRDEALAEAQRILAREGLNAQVTLQPVEHPKLDGVVLAQKISEGTRVARGSTVPLVVGKYSAPTPTSLPNVVGMHVAQARETLERQGWKVDVRREVTDDAGRKDRVLSQSPHAGSQAVPRQTTVLLKVGDQVPQPQRGGLKFSQQGAPSEITMPDTVGKTLADAQNALTGSGITRNRIVVHEQLVRDPRLSAGLVRSQKPAPGTRVPYHPTAFPVEIWVDIFKR